MHIETDDDAEAGQSEERTVRGPVWCPVATMVDQRPTGAQDAPEYRSGTRHFAPGARLYIRHIMGYRSRRGVDEPSIEVIGRHRQTHRFVRMTVRASWLEKWHVDLVYSPTVVQLLQPYWDGTEKSKAWAKEITFIEGNLAARKDSAK